MFKAIKLARPRLSRPQRDLLLAGLIFLAVLATARTYDLAERWHQFAQSHEGLELDELLFTFSFFVGAVAWFAWRRWQDFKAEAKRSAIARERLQESLHLRDLVAEGLVKARHEAQVADRAKSEFLANMSHELRTPLNATIGFAGLIEKEVCGPIGNETYRGYLAHIRESGEHLLRLIDSILDLSKIEAGKLELREEELDFVNVAQTALRIVSLAARESKVSLRAEGLEAPLLLYADSKILKQILINLLSNAIKFSDEGTEVVLSCSLSPSGACVISVLDHGIGMSDSEVKLALKPFGQIDSAFARKHGGTGLGLPLVRAFARLHGGSLRIESKSGEGTEIFVTLPVARVLQPDLISQQERASI